jgi:ferrous-iron efflux pump FieF
MNERINKHISDCQDCKEPNNQKLIRLSTYITVIGVSLIIIAKLYGWFLSESVTILASLTDSLLDICVSIMNLLAVHYALQPPDHEHRFGHGKAEDIAVFSQAVFFFLSGLFLIGKSAERLFNPNEQIISSSSEAINILIFSIAITTIIVIFQRHVMKHSKSHIIEADSMHYLTDFLTNIGAIIGIMIASHWNIVIFDSLTAIAIAIYIIFNSIKMFKKALNNLMDHELDEEDRQKIIEIIKKHKKTLGFHDLKTRYAGVKPFIQFHLELDKNMSLKQAHDISDEIETSILNIIPDADIIIHPDPEGVHEEVSYKD